MPFLTTAPANTSQGFASGTILHQYQADGSTELGNGSTTPTNTVVFKATMAAASGTKAQLQVEEQLAGMSFTGIPNATSSLVSSGTVATATSSLLANRAYHWQARAVNASGTPSAWQLFGSSTASVDFRVSSLANAASVYFNGSTTIGYPIASSTFTATDPFSLEFWYRTAVPTSTVVDLVEGWNKTFNEGYFVQRDASSGIQFYLACDTGTINFHAAANLVKSSLGTSYDASGIWHHVAITKGTGTDGNAFQLYFDGVNQTPLDFTGGSSGSISGNCFHSSSTDSIWLWRNALSTSTPNSATGTIDEVRTWNVTRSISDVSSTWNQELPATSTNLTGHWSFNNNATDLATGNATSGQSGAISFVSSTPFGHFIEAHSLVNTSVPSAPKLNWRYDATPPTYIDSVNAAAMVWGAKGPVSLASTTATSSMDLEVLEVNDSSSGFWFDIPARTIFVATSTYPTSSLVLNVAFLEYPSCIPVFYPCPEYRENVILHELGHALGLDHSYSGNIMNYSVPNPAITTLQSQDISDYDFLWGGN
jgi:predicted Zn-dependent protease